MNNWALIAILNLQAGNYRVALNTVTNYKFSSLLLLQQHRPFLPAWLIYLSSFPEPGKLSGIMAYVQRLIT